MEDVRRESLTKAAKAVQGDSETAFNVCKTPRVSVSYRLFALRTDFRLESSIAHC
jgi:hypothetical protein